jgi:hypothetical protein
LGLNLDLLVITGIDLKIEQSLKLTLNSQTETT